MVGIPFPVFGQVDQTNRVISARDSIKLRKFWTAFQDGVIKMNKTALADICEFPFYCSPCTDDTSLADNDHITIKVTEELFLSGQIKIFFSKPVLDIVKQRFRLHIFYPTFDESGKRGGV